MISIDRCPSRSHIVNSSPGCHLLIKRRNDCLISNEKGSKYGIYIKDIVDAGHKYAVLEGEKSWSSN